MEALGTLIGLVGLLGLLAGAISILRPLRFLRIDSRGIGAIVLVGGLVLLIVAGSLLPEEATETPSTSVPAAVVTTTSTPEQSTTTTEVLTTTTETTTTTSTPTTTTQRPTTTEAPSPETAIDNEIRSALGDTFIESEIIEQVDGGYGVVVTMNVSDNLTMNLIGAGFESDAGDLMIALFHDNPNLDVQWVAVDGLFPLTDQYGNTEPGEIVSIRLVREEAEKVNWSQDDAYLKLTILPGLYEWLFIHPELQEYLP